MPPNGTKVDGWAGPCLLPESLKPHLVLDFDTAQHDFYSAAQAALGWPHDLSELKAKPVAPASATPPALHRGQVQAQLRAPCSKDDTKRQRKAWLSNEGRQALERVYQRFVREVVLPHFGCDILYQAAPIWRCVLPGSVAPCAPHCYSCDRAGAARFDACDDGYFLREQRCDACAAGCRDCTSERPADCARCFFFYRLALAAIIQPRQPQGQPAAAAQGAAVAGRRPTNPSEQQPSRGPAG